MTLRKHTSNKPKNSLEKCTSIEFQNSVYSPSNFSNSLDQFPASPMPTISVIVQCHNILRNKWKWRPFIWIHLSTSTTTNPERSLARLSLTSKTHSIPKLHFSSTTPRKLFSNVNTELLRLITSDSPESLQTKNPMVFAYTKISILSSSTPLADYFNFSEFSSHRAELNWLTHSRPEINFFQPQLHK